MSGIIDSVGSKSGVVGSDVYPAGHVIYHNYGSLAADSASAMDGNWQTVTYATITVPAAVCNLCSKIVIHWNASALIYMGSGHHFLNLQCKRSTTTGVVAAVIGKNLYAGGNNGTAIGSSNPVYENWSLVGTDTDLSNADRTYIVQKKSPPSYASSANGAQTGTNVVVWGIK